MTYSYEDALQASLSYFKGEELPAKVFVDKYALRNNEGEILENTPDDMHRRMAKEFARIEAGKFKKPLSENAIYELFQGFRKLIPQGSPMSAIGNPYQIMSASNCFVVPPPEDSYGGICLTDQHIVQISKRRGGIGYDISKLRPKNTSVQNSSRTTTGCISFMHRFSHSGREVGQGGRRGAQMITISVHHPDILDFVTVKNDEVSVTGANISVRLSDEFLNAVEHNLEYELRWPVEGVKQISRMISARVVWEAIIHNAWLRAEPGLLFWDNIIRESVADCYIQFRTTSTNPCGEITLSNHDSCRLLAINLISYVVNLYTSEAYFDYQAFYKDAQIAQRLMDDLVDLELEQINKILDKISKDEELDSTKMVEKELWELVKQACENGRRTGLGITGLGDTLAALGIKYGSDQSIAVTDKIYKTLKFGSYRSSVDMAKEIGAFPAWSFELEKDNPFLNRIKDEELNLNDGEVVFESGQLQLIEQSFVSGKQLFADIERYGRRNIANLTTAPTGSISIMAGILDMFNISSGIEPVYALETDRFKKVNHSDENAKVDFVDKMGDKWSKFAVYHSGLALWLKANPDKKKEESPYFGATAEDINWVQRVKLQAAAQRHIDHSISSTINLPNDVKEEEVAKIYEAAWKAGCKGVTVYRDGCRSGVIVKKDKGQEKAKLVRPKELPCNVHHINVKGKSYFVLVGLMDGKPYEVFAGKNGFLKKSIETGSIVRKNKNYYKALFDDETELSPITASCNEYEEAITRLTSALLRSGADMHLIVQQLEKVNGEMHSFAKSVARALKTYIPDGTIEEGEICPECGSTNVVRQSGCQTCLTCSWSKCN